MCDSANVVKLKDYITLGSVGYGVAAVVILCLGTCACSSETETWDDNDSWHGDGSVDAATASVIRRVELGELSTDPLGVSPFVSFEVPSGAISFTIEVVSEEPDVSLTLAALHEPAGDQLVVFGRDPTLCTECENRVVSAEGAAAFLVPNTPRINVTPGTYRFRLYAFRLTWEGMLARTDPASTRVSATVLLKLGPAEPASGTIALNLFLTGAGGITAANASLDQRLQKALARMQSIYHQVGISIDRITFVDISDQFRVIETMSGTNNDLSRMFALSATAPEGLSIFLVEELVLVDDPTGGVGIVLGITGGIPGPPDRGTVRSGIAVALGADLEVVTDYLGTTLAHEGGHYLGLFHTSELTPLGVHDTIDDTPEDDPKNLMHYAAGMQEPPECRSAYETCIADGGAQQSCTAQLEECTLPRLTPGQGFVMHRNPLIR